MYQAIGYELRDDVAIITLNRPDVMNALSTQMRAEITHAVRRAEKEARALVMTGAGTAFCSGQDLGDSGRLSSLDLERVLRDEYLPMARALQNCEIPTIAAVNGAAAGAGAILALLADVAIASEEAFFVQAFSRIGLIPDSAGTYLLPRQIGHARAMGAMLFADRITARQACDWGMIYEVVEQEDFAAHWWTRARHLASGPSETYKYIKEAMRATWKNDLEEQFLLEARLQGKCAKTRDFKEGVLAFSQKRPAQFEGR